MHDHAQHDHGHAHDPAAHPAPQWSTEVVEETLGDDARRLTVDVSARLMASWWDRYAELAGVPRRRWLALRPTNDGPLIDIVDGRPAFDLAAWMRFASLAAGAVAMPARTAAAFGLAVEQLAPPSPRPWRLADLVRARGVTRRMRRGLARLEADLARHARLVREDLVPAALAPGDDGTPVHELPAYALAARLEQLLDAAGATWVAPVLLDHAAGAAVERLQAELLASGVPHERLDLELALRTSGGGATRPRHVEALGELARSADPVGGLDAWLERWGWHALRDVPIEATPLREQREEVARWLDLLVAEARGADAGGAAAPHRPGVELRDAPEVHDDEATREARRLVALREQLGHVRGDLHAGLRAVAWMLAAQLAATGAVEDAHDTFDLPLVRVLALARGAAAEAAGDARAANVSTGAPSQAASSDGRAAIAPTATAGAATERLPVGGALRGHPAGAGSVAARAEVVLVSDPPPDLAVEGAILVCRNTDPGWMPLLLRCSGVVTERGGPLSHAAIVARELGLPVVVGAAGATTRLTSAMVLEVDGRAGTVTRLR